MVVLQQQICSWPSPSPSPFLMKTPHCRVFSAGPLAVSSTASAGAAPSVAVTFSAGAGTSGSIAAGFGISFAAGSSFSSFPFNISQTNVEKPPPAEPSTNLFISGLSKRTTTEGLRTDFAKFGEVVRAKIVTDRVSGYSKGYGFVHYASLEDAASGTKGMDGQLLDGWVIFAEYAKPRPPNPDVHHSMPSATSIITPAANSLPRFTADQWAAFSGAFGYSPSSNRLHGKLEVVDWIIDTGCSHHVTGDKSCLLDINVVTPCPVDLPDGQTVVATKEGVVRPHNPH